MRRSMSIMLNLLSLTFGAAGSIAAQENADRWLERCQGDDHRDRDWERFCEVRLSGFHPGGTPLRFESDMNGGVEIYGWDRDSVAISARVQTHAPTQADAQAIAREIRLVVSGGSTVRVEGPTTGRRQGWGVILVVLVPTKVNLEARSTNGPLSVDGVSGIIELRATNGPVSLTRVSGDVRARVQNGPLSVQLGGSSWDGGGLDAESVNGPVDLAIPDRYNAELETGTVNGPADFQVPLRVTLHGRRSDRIRATLGTGGPLVRVVTTNGPITVRRAAGN